MKKRQLSITAQRNVTASPTSSNSNDVDGSIASLPSNKTAKERADEDAPSVRNKNDNHNNAQLGEDDSNRKQQSSSPIISSNNNSNCNRENISNDQLLDTQSDTQRFHRAHFDKSTTTPPRTPLTNSATSPQSQPHTPPRRHPLRHLRHQKSPATSVTTSATSPAPARARGARVPISPTAKTISPATKANEPAAPLLYNNLEQMISNFNMQGIDAEVFRLLMKTKRIKNPFAQDLKQRYQNILGVKIDDDPQSFLDEAHKCRDRRAQQINNVKRDKGRKKGECYCANFGNLPKDVAGILLITGFWLLNYATFDCAKYDGGGDKNNKMWPKNAIITWCMTTITTLLANDFMNANEDCFVQHNGNAKKINFSDLNPACLDKGTYNGAYKSDANQLVRLLGLHDVLNPPKQNQKTVYGRAILHLGGILGLVEAVTAYKLATNLKKVHIMVGGSDPRSAIGDKDDPFSSVDSTTHPETYLTSEKCFKSSHFTEDVCRRYDVSLKRFLIHHVKIFDSPLMEENVQSRLQRHNVSLTVRMARNELSDAEKSLLNVGFRTRTRAFDESKSDSCQVLFLPQYNAVYVIGNKQTTPVLKSSMWDGTAIARSKFCVIKLAGDIDVSTLEAGLKLQDELNKALEGHEEDSVGDCISALSSHGVVGYTQATFEDHFKRTKAFDESKSDSCQVLFLPQYNAVYVIGNKQTTPVLKSSMWDGTAIARGKFGVIKLAGDIDVSTLEAGLKLQDELNKALEGLEERSVDDRISSLSTQGVVGYRHPMIHCKGWATHFEEIAAIAKNEKNWICIDDSNGAKVRVLLILYGNSSSNLYRYFKSNFARLSAEELINHECWQDIHTFNWQHYSIAKSKFEAEENAKKGKNVGQALSRQQKKEMLKKRMINTIK
eukprot:scaffold1769_cov132-Skeletonema_dohrnii-CCMP3373.AAC.6